MITEIPTIESEDCPASFLWILAIPENGVGDQHIIPGGDLRDHVTSDDCWCSPQLTDHPMAGLSCQHKALDDREAYFSGVRKYN